MRSETHTSNVVFWLSLTYAVLVYSKIIGTVSSLMNCWCSVGTRCLEYYYSDFYRVLLSSHLPLHIGIPLKKTAWRATITLFSCELYTYYILVSLGQPTNRHLSDLGSSLVPSKCLTYAQQPQIFRNEKPDFFPVHISCMSSPWRLTNRHNAFCYIN